MQRPWEPRSGKAVSHHIVCADKDSRAAGGASLETMPGTPGLRSCRYSAPGVGGVAAIAGYHMDMQVKNGLPRGNPHVDAYVPSVGLALAFYLFLDPGDGPEQGRLFFRRGIEPGRYMAFGYQEGMARRYGKGVPEPENDSVFVKNASLLRMAKGARGFNSIVHAISLSWVAIGCKSYMPSLNSGHFQRGALLGFQIPA